MSISKNKLVEFLDCIQKKKIETITFEEVFSLQKRRKGLKNKIVLTFDDCPISLFDFAIPELQKRGMKAVFYISTNYIDGVNVWDIEEHGTSEVKLMSSEQLRRISSFGMEVGSHGDKHVRFDKMELNEVCDDMSKSKQLLENILKTPVLSIAFPYGRTPSDAKKILSICGYNFGLTIYSLFQSRYTLRRFQIHQSDNCKTMNRKLGMSYKIMRIIYDPVLLFFKALLRK
ncbi:polysaccharide deacetylase family protein [Pedobacter aquatilis]|uniref:polysaccharide deacetylase family protein n=1 Tax=Pedobacter aquatilis TaxID=351343 RepID=UPI00292CAC8E|nr:polysaccharide deacetylase family protein [Pedobacter aquatilis]